MATQRFPWFALGLIAGTGALLFNRARRPHRLAGKVVLITGGSRGLGLELARECLARRAFVALLGRDPETLARAAEQLDAPGQVQTLPCDVGNEADVRAAVELIRERLGEVDVVMHCAGEMAVGPAKTMTRSDFQRALDTHLFGAIHLVNAVVPGMRKRRSGSIVIVSSVGGLIALPHMLPYSASKFALSGYSEALHAELANDGISVTTVYPGLMRTGSPRHASFKGQHRREYAWFALADALPFVSMSARRAARRIVSATERGCASLLMVPFGKVLLTLKALLPGLSAGVLSMVNRALPRGGDAGTEAHKGHESESAVSRSALTALSRRAEVRNNQV
jgi:NAD(P)-dependent dehydrogenase (short-subunit alcohol dehydrogenase family)